MEQNKTSQGYRDFRISTQNTSMIVHHPAFIPISKKAVSAFTPPN